MCGLFGVAGPGILGKHLRAFRELGMVSQLRGVDASGVFQIATKAFNDKKRIGRMAKTAVDFTAFSAFHQWSKGGDNKLMDDIQCNLFIGHVRAATVGDINDANSHPFDLDDLVGAHNGTLVDRKYQHDKMTDSEMMFRDMEDIGVESVLQSLHRESAFAVSIYDRVNNELILAHNSKRSLAVAFCAKESVMFWASEEWMLLGVLARNNIEICKSYNLRQDVVGRVDPSTVKTNNDAIFDITELKYSHNNVRKPEPARFRNWQKEYVTADVANGVSLPWDEDYHEHDWAGAEFWENALEKATKEEEKAGERSEAASSAIRDHSFVAPNSSVSKRIDYASCCNCGSLLTPLGKYYANKTEKDSGYTDYECSDCVIAEVTHKGEPEKVN
tara:strand:+ start:73 stop:1233 length:1161 start_codon:yes stop_codon:yes gene_type:complete